jgi:hypothetical protein
VLAVDYVLWLVIATSLAQLPSLRPVPADSVPRVRRAEAPRALAGLDLVLPPGTGTFRPDPFAQGAVPQRPHAIEHSDFYYTVLTVHRIASYATIPLFVSEYFLGQKLISNPPGSRSAQAAHSLVALGLAGLFGVNTATGLWNLWDSRKDQTGRARRYIHAALMIAADAGFVATASAAPSPRRVTSNDPEANRHRTLAIASMSTALASYVMMLLWKN